MALNYVVLGERIRKLRTERRISQDRLADMIDRSPTFVSRLEQGEKGPSLDTLQIPCTLLSTACWKTIAQPFSGTGFPEWKQSSSPAQLMSSLSCTDV